MDKTVVVDELGRVLIQENLEKSKLKTVIRHPIRKKEGCKFTPKEE